MAYGLLSQLEPEDGAQLGLLGLMGLGQTLGANRRRYAVGQIPEAGPGPTAWVPGAVNGLRDIRNFALLRKQQEEASQMRQMQMDELRRKEAARLGMSGALKSGDPTAMRNALYDYSPDSAIAAMNKEPKRYVVDKALVDDSGKPLYEGKQDPKYKERDFPVTADKIQKQISTDGGLTWQNSGVTYDRRDPYLVFDRSTPGGGQERVAVPRPGSSAEGVPGKAVPLGETKSPGAPEGVSAEAAGRLALVTEGESAVKALKERLLKDGKADRRALLSLAAGIPTTEGQQIKNLFKNAIGNRIRIESGANITEAEMNNQLARYMPGPLDSDKLVEQKLNGLERFFSDFRAVSKGTEKLDSKVLRFDAKGNPL